MYNAYYGLNRSPFDLTPDPFFVFPTFGSKEALAGVYYGIRERKGFVVLTGEVGTGKTLLVRCLLESLTRQQIPFANIFNPRLSAIEFLRYVAFDLGLMVPVQTKAALLQALYKYATTQVNEGRTTVLVIDEAHQLSPSLLEEIRLFTNFESTQQKLVQVVLVGQPELDSKLDSFRLRQLKQRIAIRCRLEPLLEAETNEYIERRLLLAGATLPDARALFPPATMEAVYHYSVGIPRLINSICDQALLAAYGKRLRVVPVELIAEIASYFRLQHTSPDDVEPFSSRLADHKAAAQSLVQLLESMEQTPTRLSREDS